MSHSTRSLSASAPYISTHPAYVPVYAAPSLYDRAVWALLTWAHEAIRGLR